MLLSVDPGGCIGWCIGETLPEPDLLAITEWGEEKDHQKFLNDVWDRMNKGQFGWVVCENFVPRPGVLTWQPAALHQIGALKWMTGKVGVPFILQSVSDANTFATPAKLQAHRQAGVGKGGKGHAVMSLKHAVMFRWLDYYG